MPKIYLETQISAPVARVFDLSRSIDLHKISTHKTKEEAIAGKTSGLISLGETVTWKAKHFGVMQKLTSKITACNAPHYFEDIQIKGAFKDFKHEHHFKTTPKGTLLVDVFGYTAPLGFLGKIADILFLERYMTNFLIERNGVLKRYAESELWKEVLR